MKHKKPVPMDDDDPRSKFHRVCINILWSSVLFGGLAWFYWLLFTTGLPLGLSIIGVLFGLLGWVPLCIQLWAIHAAPPGEKFDAWVGPRR